jgi:hypothetical protein
MGRKIPTNLFPYEMDRPKTLGLCLRVWRGGKGFGGRKAEGKIEKSSKKI